MKLSTKTMALTVMAALSLAAAGCSTASADPTRATLAMNENAVAPSETPASAPVETTIEKDARFFHFYAPFAPPAARFEFRGVAPSARHFWAPGYYRWNGREHVWVGGSWVLGRPGFAFVGPAWRQGARRWEYDTRLSGRLRRTG